VRDELDMSASDNLIVPSLPSLAHLRSSEARDEFDLSDSTNLIAPSVPISLTVLSENEMK
jgi:hypothetical protein